MPTYVPLTDAQITAGRFMNPFRFRDNPRALYNSRAMQVLSADVARGDTLGGDNFLNFPVGPQEVWWLSGHLLWSQDSSGQGGSIRVLPPSSPAQPGYVVGMTRVNVGVLPRGLVIEGAVGASIEFYWGAYPITNRVMTFSALAMTGDTAGNMGLQWASRSPTFSLTMKAGSYFAAVRMDQV